MNSLATLVNADLEIEKLRVAAQVRQTHLSLQGRSDPDTDDLKEKLEGLEKYIDGKIAERLESHPAYGWFSRVKGIGKENIGKVVGQIRVKPEKDDEGNELPYADTISALWKFAGFSVENSKAPKRVTGEKLSYNSNLRSMCWRVGTSLMRANGKFYEYYLAQKEAYVQRYTNQGWKIVPAAKIPQKNGKKLDGDGFISEGHLHNMALRKVIKLFLSLLWVSWREGEGLPISTPYSEGVLGHTHIVTPEEMTDR